MFFKIVQVEITVQKDTKRKTLQKNMYEITIEIDIERKIYTRPSLIAFSYSISGDYYIVKYQKENITRKHIQDCHRERHQEEEVYKIVIKENTKRKISM